MKPKSALRNFIALAGGSMLIVSSATAATYIWNNSNVTGTPTASLNWFNATQGSWTGGTPVSDNTNTIQFFQDNTTALPNTANPSTQASVLDNGGSAFQLGILTLSGRGSATANANLTMNISGDALNFSALTGTINLDALNNTRTITYNVSNNIQLGTASSAGALTFTGNGTSAFNFSGIISELQTGGGSVIKSGSSALTLSGNNTFTGGITVNAGTLTLSGTQSFTGGLTLNGGSVGFAALSLNGNNISVLSNSIITSGGTYTSAIGLSASAMLDIRLNTGTFTTSGAVTGAGGIILGQSGSGGTTLNFNSTSNTFTGPIEYRVTPNAGQNGTLSVNSIGDAVSLGSGDIRFGVAGTGTNSHIFNFGGSVGAPVGPLTFNNRRFELTGTHLLSQINNNSAQNFTINTDLLVTATAAQSLTLGGTGAGISTYVGKIADNPGNVAGVVSLTKAGASIWNLTNASNSYTGTTTVSGGTLGFANGTLGSVGTINAVGGTLLWLSGNTQDISSRLTMAAGTSTFNTNGNNVTFASAIGSSTTGALTKTGLGTLTLKGLNTYTGATTLNAGTLELDYSSQNNSKLSDTAALILNGGSLVLRGGASDNHEEVVLGTTLTGTAGTFISREAGSVATINLNAFTLTGNTSTVSFSAENIAKTDRLNTNGILGAWFTVGSHWAINSTNAVDGLITAYSGYTDFSLATGTSEDTNFELKGGSGPLGGAIKTNTLRIEGTANDQILNLGANNLQVSNLNGTNAVAGTSGGLLYAGGANGNYTISGSGAVVGENPNGQGYLINTYTGTLNITAKVGNGSSPLFKAGEGTLVLGADNTTNMTGAIRVYQGVLRLTNNGGAGSTAGGIFVQNGAALELVNGIAIGAEALTIAGNGVSNAGALRNVASSTSSYAGAITIGSGGARINSDASGALTLSGGVVTSVFNNVTFGGAGNTTVSTTAISGAGGLIKDGTGTLTLSATNTYTGTTTVSEGRLIVDGSISTSTLTSVDSGATLGGGGTVGALSFNGLGLFDLAQAVAGSPNALDASTISFATAGFGIDNLVSNGAAIVWASILDGTYTLINGTLDNANLDNFGLVNAASIGVGRSAYFQNGSLQLVVATIPEPTTALLGCLGALLILRRRRS